MKFTVLFVILLLIVAYPINTIELLAQISIEDKEKLTYHLELVSTGWVQTSVDTSNMILSNTNYDFNDWELFFTEYFNNHSFTDDLRNYLGYPVFSWFSIQARQNLQLGLFRPIAMKIDSIMFKYSNNLGSVIENQINLRQSLFNSHRFMHNMINWGIIDSLRIKIYKY